MTPQISTPSLQTVSGDGGLPIVPVHCPPDAASHLAWVREVREEIRSLLQTHGHLLIRGLGVQTAGEFAAVRDVLLSSRADYKEKATPRSHYVDDVYSSTDLPPTQRIRLHNENSYTLSFPGVLLFGCLVAPSEGGATTVADVRQVLAEMPADIVRRFRAGGWLLRRSYNEQVSLPWQTAFNTNDPAEVQRYCDSHLIGVHWRDDGSLQTAQRRSAIVRHPRSGEEVWFNHVAFWSRWSLDEEVREVLLETYGDEGLPFDTACGDGEPLGMDEIDAMNAAYDRCTRRERYRVGDLLLVDNVLSAHGRDPFRGKRQIVVAMGEALQLSDCGPTVPASTGS